MRRLLGIMGALALTAGCAWGQTTLDNPRGQWLPYLANSGARANHAADATLVYEDVVKVPGAAWLRVHFADAVLPKGSFVRLIATLDGEVQQLDANAIAQWSMGSAFFNGDTVVVELWAGPGTEGTMIDIQQVMWEPRHAPQQAGSCGICGTDDRAPSNQDFACRLMPVGCSATVYNEDSCMVSAGHCSQAGLVAQFRVPASTSGCDLVNPPVAEQFPVTARQANDGGVGADWMVLQVGTNNQAQRPFQRYGVFRAISTTLANAGNALQIYGYGIDSQCTRTQTQQLSSGSISQRNSTYYDFNADSTFGNSGSHILVNNLIVGVVTHCRSNCPNIGTRVDLAAFAAARDSLCGDGGGGPDNNNCADATPINLGNTPFNNIGATTDGPAHALCDNAGDNNVQADVWFRWTSNCTGTLTVSTCSNADFDTKIAVYTGTTCPATDARLLGCNDDFSGCSNFTSQLAVSVTAGTSYLIRVGGYNGDTGSGTLNLATSNCLTPPANDACGAPFTLNNGTTPFTNVNATTDGPAVTNCDSATTAGSDIWYTYTATCTGDVTITTCGSNFDTVLVVYTGTSCLQIQGRQVICDDDTCGLQSSVTFPATQGEVFKVRVGGFNAAQGTGVLNVSCDAPVACPADCDGNNLVNAADVGCYLNLYFLDLANGTTVADCDNNGVINAADVGCFLNLYLASIGPCP